MKQSEDEKGKKEEKIQIIKSNIKRLLGTLWSTIIPSHLEFIHAKELYDGIKKYQNKDEKKDHCIKYGFEYGLLGCNFNKEKFINFLNEEFKKNVKENIEKYNYRLLTVYDFWIEKGNKIDVIFDSKEFEKMLKV